MKRDLKRHVLEPVRLPGGTVFLGWAAMGHKVVKARKVPGDLRRVAPGVRAEGPGTVIPERCSRCHARPGSPVLLQTCQGKPTAPVSLKTSVQLDAEITGEKRASETLQHFRKDGGSGYMEHGLALS
jgi:hypothetical protein